MVVALVIAICAAGVAAVPDLPRQATATQLARRVQELDPALTITADTVFALRRQPGRGRHAAASASCSPAAARHHAAAVADVRRHAAVDALHQQLDVHRAEAGQPLRRSSPRSPMACFTGAAPSPPSSPCSCWAGWACAGCWCCCCSGSASLLSPSPPFGFASAGAPDAGRMPRGLRHHRLPGGAQCLGGTHLSVPAAPPAWARRWGSVASDRWLARWSVVSCSTWACRCSRCSTCR